MDKQKTGELIKRARIKKGKVPKADSFATVLFKSITNK